MNDAGRSGKAGLRNVFALGFVSFFTDISSEMCFSILPTFILGLPGATLAFLGFIEGLAEALSYGLRAISGVFSDRFRRRKTIVFVGYALSNAVKPLFSVAQTVTDALIVRVGDRIGKAVRTSPRDALLSEFAPERRIGTAFGVHRTLDQTGAILGPVLASSFMLFLGFTVRDVFWLSFIPGFAALVILLTLVQERVGKPAGKGKVLTGIGTIIKGRFSVLLLLVGLFSIGAFNFSFILLKAKEAGVSEALIPLVYAMLNVAHTMIAIPSGFLSDKIGREKVLIMGYGIFLMSALLLSAPFVGVVYAFFVAFVYGAYVGIVETVQRALVPGYAPSDLRGTAYGIYYLTVGASFLLANTIIGYLWDTFGSSVPFLYSAITSGLAMIGIAAFVRARS